MADPDPIILNGVFGSITLKDGTTPTALFVKLDTDNADFSIGPLKRLLNEGTRIERRGRKLGRAIGARIYPELSFTCHHVAEFSHATKKTIQAFILGLPPFAARKTTFVDGHPEFACTVEFEYDDGNGGELIEAHDVVFTIDSFSDGDEAGSWSLSGEVDGRVYINEDLAAAEIGYVEPD